MKQKEKVIMLNTIKNFTVIGFIAFIMYNTLTANADFTVKTVLIVLFLVLLLFTNIFLHVTMENGKKYKM